MDVQRKPMLIATESQYFQELRIVGRLPCSSNSILALYLPVALRIFFFHVTADDQKIVPCIKESVGYFMAENVGLLLD
jgi:hypothetical protein